MVDHLKNFDLSSPEVRQQFGEWINISTFTWVLFGSWNTWILQEKFPIICHPMPFLFSSYMKILNTNIKKNPEYKCSFAF
jgi:hypothetical protein